jgi:outer membrane receptor protein involved in Fe transport
LSGYGSAAADLDQHVSVNEGFAEVRVPVVQDRPLAEELSLAAGYRFSGYSTAGTTNTYRFDLQYAPLKDARLRASYDRVVRAPSLIELFTPLSYNDSNFIDTDPCAPTDGGATHAEASQSACQRTGVSAAQYGNGFGPAVGGTNSVPQCPTGCSVAAGGNAKLKPETADTWSVGLTFTPTAVPSLQGSIDYFHIHLRGAIGAVPETVTLQQCLSTSDPALCSQITRAANGALFGGNAGGGYILSNAVNTGEALVSGIDLQVSYRLALDRFGALSANLTGSWLEHNIATPYLSAPSYDCAGLFGDTCLSSSVNPAWRHNLRLSWDTPWRLKLTAQWRFISRTLYDNNSSQPALSGKEEGFFDAQVLRIPNYSYLDVTAAWALTSRVQLRFGVANLFDKDPPFVPLEASGRGGTLNTFPAYDLLGRNFFLALRATL